MSLRLESWEITPECRSNRGQTGAWQEACDRLHEVYRGQTNHEPGVTLRLVIERVRVETVESGPPMIPAVGVPKEPADG